MIGKKRLHYPGIALIIAAALAYAGPYYWAADLFAHFRPHYAALALALLVLSIALRRFRVAILYTGTVLLAVPPLAADIELRSTPTNRSDLNLFVWNMNYRAVKAAEGIDMIRQADADIVVLSEVSVAWREHLALLDEIYPHREHIADCGLVGCEMSVLSKFPWRIVREHVLVPDTPPIIVADFPAAAGRPAFLLVAVHLTNVVNGRGGALQLAQISELGALVRQLPGRIIMAGDMNATPSSAFYRAIVHETGLAGADISLQPTWPALLGPLGIAIDHVFVRGIPGVAVRRLGAGGSDHTALEAAVTFGE